MFSLVLSLSLVPDELVAEYANRPKMREGTGAVTADISMAAMLSLKRVCLCVCRGWGMLGFSSAQILLENRHGRQFSPKFSS